MSSGTCVRVSVPGEERENPKQKSVFVLGERRSRGGIRKDTGPIGLLRRAGSGCVSVGGSVESRGAISSERTPCASSDWIDHDVGFTS